MVSLRRVVPPQYTLQSSDEALLVDTTAGAVNLVLPTVGTLGERFIPVTIVGGNLCTLQCSGSDLVEGSSTLLLPLADAQYVLVTTGSSTWRILMMARQTYGQANEANEVDLVSSPASNAPIVRPRSPNTDVDLWLFGKGTGQTYVNGALALNANNTTTTPTASKIPTSLSDKRLADGWMRHFFMTKRLSSFTHIPGGNTWNYYGTPATLAQIGTGAGASGDSASLPSETQSTGNVTGNTAGLITSVTVTQRGWSPTGVFKVLTAASIANIRLIVGFVSADLSGVGTPTTQHVAIVWYDTGVHGTAFWRCTTCDGTTVLTTVTSIPITNSTVWNHRVEIDEASATVTFYINDVLAAVHSSNIPGQTQQLYMESAVTTLANAVKRLGISSMHLIQN